MSLQESKLPEFRTYMAGTVERIKAFKGCEHLDLLNDKNDPNIFFSYSIWQNEESLEEYRRSEVFKEIWSTIKPWFVKNSQAWTVDNVFDSIGDSNIRTVKK